MTCLLRCQRSNLGEWSGVEWGGVGGFLPKHLSDYSKKKKRWVFLSYISFCRFCVSVRVMEKRTGLSGWCKLLNWSRVKICLTPNPISGPDHRRFGASRKLRFFYPRFCVAKILLNLAFKLSSPNCAQPKVGKLHPNLYLPFKWNRPRFGPIYRTFRKFKHISV